MKKKIVVVMLALSFSILGGCGSEYQEAYKEMQAEAEKQAAEMQAEAEKQAAEMQKEIEKQTEAIIKGSAEQEQDQEQTGETETEPAETDQTEVVEVQEETEEYPDEVDGITVLFYEKVHNDVTGNWRLAVIYDGSDLNSYVGDFYKAYVKDDSEVFGIVNLGLKTSARVSRVMDNWLDVTVTEYQDGEEHDANLLYSGMELSHYWIDMETGEIDTLEE